MEILKKIMKFCIKYRIWIAFSLFSILFFANCFCKEISYAVFSVLIFFTLFDNLENGLSYIIFCLPFCLIYFYISMIIYLVCIAIYIIKFYIMLFFKEKGKLHWIQIVSIICFLIYALLPIGRYNLNLCFKLALIVIIYAALIGLLKKKNVFRIIFNLRILCVSLIISCLFGTTYFISPYLQSIYTLSYISNTSLFRYVALLWNPNVLAMLCEIVLSILAYSIITNKSKTKWIDIFLFICVCIVGVFTFSKTFLIIFVFILLALFVWGLSVNWKKSILFLIFFLGMCVIVYFIRPSLFSTYIYRFIGNLQNCKNAEEIMNMLTTSRYNLWKTTFNYLIENPLRLFFGCGLGAPLLSTYSAHNAYLSMVHQLGIVGSVLFLLPIITLVKKILKENKLSKAIIIPLLTILLLFFVEDTLFYIFPI